MTIKNIVPNVFAKKEEWKEWRANVEDYIETLETGMKAVAKTVKSNRRKMVHRSIPGRLQQRQGVLQSPTR